MHPSKDKLIELVHDARKGEVVLPEFQRSFIWDRQSIEELLVSILNDYFIGTLLILDVLPDDPPFKPRLVEGINHNEGMRPRRMILDGQQRLTSVHYVLYGPDVNLKNTSFPYRFFINLQEFLKENWESVVFSRPTYWQQTQELYQDKELQYKEGLLSFKYLVDWDDWQSWYEGYRDFHRNEGTFNKGDASKIAELARRFLNFEVAVVELPQKTSLYKIVEIFERINRTGEPLSVFELLTARLWKYEINLRELWEKTREKYSNISELSSDKEERYPKFILQVIALLRNGECKRNDLITLAGDSFVEDWETASCYVEESVKRLRNTKSGGYGVVPRLYFPYSTMIPPLASILHEVDKKYKGEAKAYVKIHKWYWGTLFRERYGGSTDTLSYRDYNAMIRWLEDDNDIPEAVVTDISQLQRNVIDVVRKGAVYYGILSLIAKKGARDFYTSDTIELHELDDHHIFPRSFLEKKGYEQDKRNTIVNRTLISSDTNQKLIRDKSPSKYLEEMEKRHGPKKSREVLRTHLIYEDAYEAMKLNDYDAFLEARGTSIQREIEKHCLFRE